ncbi:MAG: hypothetical protein A2729_00760 [Candidatus Buchananbacteria bacterium RIFCSPHIGHO2_01_FULL_39_14]|uniref:Peptidase S9 prolyl oligopeptidase catalytic domain-containing protein n=1 Tax=Candidatus Buchananbacteria bacterium RIFCSPHIGHO2_01_FULL_39_14 TaxID=1797532 RepID=A0A1G1XVY8_9BACT|nr:MAG: hypothetical protein A3B17_02800 [Candidatus Yanofskybacteria bacterium RIFCSPLOWO2_01_FULL_45_72]OGY43766.1 MAG: hypothetical protein A2729_00760 [Candidatus Buchananbacteria bacterium RIFCSPHIGHO2_01_FULL_39_14]OGY49566.1 MAG: hypothetical protein A3D39_02020 [Candidatus Buchananbacteria bacterium RIFCSPHIGHO2_02_FULL_39_17]
MPRNKHDPHLNETEVQYNRIKKGNILTEVYHIPSSTNNVVLLFCYGIPSHPFDRFPFGLESYLRQGYILAYPHYEGTFGSEGVCTIENAVNSVLVTLRVLLDGDLSDLISGERFNIKPQRIILVGGSFGGSVALIAAAKSDEINNVISVAGPTNYKGRDFSKLKDRLSRAYNKEWNISPLTWRQLMRGKVDINPIDYVKKLKNKNTYLIHGEADPIIPADYATRLYEMLRDGFGKHQILIEPNVGHVGCHYIGMDHVHESLESWLNESL